MRAPRVRWLLVLAPVAALVAFGCGFGGSGGGPRPPGPNTPPVAVAAASRTCIKAAVSVTFDGTGSYDPDGDTLTYRWDLGHDGATLSGAVVSHAFPSAGTYTVTLTVTDPREASGTDTVAIQVTAPGAPTAVVDSVTLKGTLTDDALPDDHVTVTLTPPGSVGTAPVTLGAFSYAVATAGAAVTADVVGEDFSGNSDSETFVIQP